LRKWAAIISLGAAQFVMVLDTTVMNVSLTQVASDLDTTINDLQSVTAGNGYWYLIRPANCGGGGSYDSGAPKQILVHGTDNIVCQGDTVWIVHAVPLESSISIRRYALDGTLLRFVESPLPPVGTERRFAFVDAATVRESDDAIWFDRIEIEHSRDFSDPDKVVGRDTFRIPLAELP